MKFLKTTSFALLLACALGTAAQPSTRVIGIIVPQPPGNPTDGVARKLQTLLQNELKQTVIVDNAAGRFYQQETKTYQTLARAIGVDTK